MTSCYLPIAKRVASVIENAKIITLTNYLNIKEKYPHWLELLLSTETNWEIFLPNFHCILTTVIFIVKSMTRVLFYFTFSDARTVVLLGLF